MRLAHELGADAGELAAVQDVEGHPFAEVLADADLRHADRLERILMPSG